MTVTIKWNGISWTGNTKSHTREKSRARRAHLKGIFPEMERYGKEEFDHVLHCISSFIDDFTFKVRNSRYRGDILKRTISNDCLKVFNLGDEKVILTVSFTPLET